MALLIRIILSSSLGTVIGGLLFSSFTTLIAFILNKADKAGGWIGVIQNPILLALFFGAAFGGLLGFLIGLVIGGFKITEVVKGGIVGFCITECLLLVFLLVVSLSDLSEFNNYRRLTDSIVSNAFLFLIFTFVLFTPSVVIGGLTVKLNDFIRSFLNLEN